MQALIDPTRPLRESPRRQRRALAKPLADDASSGADRDSALDMGQHLMRRAKLGVPPVLL